MIVLDMEYARTRSVFVLTGTSGKIVHYMNVRIIAPNKVRVIAKQESVPAIKDFTETIAREETALMIVLEKASVIFKQGSVFVRRITRVKIVHIKSV